PKLYNLPGMDNPNSDLRRCLADIVWDYPASLANPMVYLRRFQKQNRNKLNSYEGDLETDYLRSLGEIQGATRENPLGVEADFRS
ncbi:hypothetical protein ACFLXT_04540, partial [Chloroflexota bacterium]